MVGLNTLQPAAGSRKCRTRVGRGQGNGKGCTAGMGNNGNRARSGSRSKPYFEGGQTPLIRRTPKKGFVHASKVTYQIVNVGDIEKLAGTEREIDAQALYDSGLIHSKDMPVKILGVGQLSKSVVVKADAYSKSARDKLKMPKATSRS